MGGVVVTVPRYVKTYPSFIGEVAELEPDLPIGERVRIGCALRRKGFKLIYEYYDEKVEKFLDALCGTSSTDAEWLDLDDLELDTYLQCSRPHPVLGCRFIYYTNAALYQYNGGYAVVAKLPNGQFVWHKEAKNVFTAEPLGRPINSEAFLWMSLSKNEDFTKYDRYHIMLDALRPKFSARLYIDPYGNVIEAEVYTK